MAYGDRSSNNLHANRLVSNYCEASLWDKLRISNNKGTSLCLTSSSKPKNFFHILNHCDATFTSIRNSVTKRSARAASSQKNWKPWVSRSPKVLVRRASSVSSKARNQDQRF